MDPHTPIYASLVPLRVECPFCGRIILFGKWGRASTRNVRDLKAYDPYHSVLICPDCRHAYYVGLVLWDAPSVRDKGERLRDVAPGVRPTRKQLAQIRLRGGATKGFWMDEGHVRGEPVTVYEPGECTCLLGRVRECPKHGPGNLPIE